jgi:hypothetical protein
MASYKIYFLNFCYKNCSSSATNKPAKLQNASLRAVFLKIVIFAPVGDASTAADCRGTIVKTQQAFNSSISAQQHVDQVGHVTDVDAAVAIDVGSCGSVAVAQQQVDQVGHVADVDSAIAIHVTNLGRRDFNPA